MSGTENRGGRPAIGEPINIRLGDDNLAWLDRLATSNGTSRADVVRGIVTAARERSIEPTRMPPYGHAAFVVKKLGQYAPDQVNKFGEASALWSAYLQSANGKRREHARLMQEVRDVADAEDIDDLDALTPERMVALAEITGAAAACDREHAEQEARIADCVQVIIDAARAAGAGAEVEDVLAE